MEFFTRVISEIAGGSGFAYLPEDWRQVLMIGIACILLYMGIGKGYEPLLMVPIAFGMLLANLALPLSGLMAEPHLPAAGRCRSAGYLRRLPDGPVRRPHHQRLKWCNALYPCH